MSDTAAKIGIVIPAYKEQENIRALIEDVLRYLPAARIALVDDSPDIATVKAVEELKCPSVSLIHRAAKGGRGSAVLDGLRLLLAQGCAHFIEMDADFSHPPRQLPEMLEVARERGLDLLIASRYLSESVIRNWPLSRRIFSRFSNRLARILLGIPVADYTNGYRLYSRPAAEEVCRSCGRFGKGFIALSEILVNLHGRGYRIGEVPTVFVNRVRGESSVNTAEIRMAVWGLLRIFLYKHIAVMSPPQLGPAKLRQRYLKDGYVLLKGVFSTDEVSDFRERIRKASEEPGCEILGRRELRTILLDERILDPLRAVLGPRLVYFGDSTFRYETADGLRAFHQDSQLDYEDPSSTEYPVARIGLYLQDHSRHGGGLKVRRGSHRHVFLGRTNLRRLLFGAPHGPLQLASFRLGKGVNLEIEPGDLVIWNLRTWHSGYVVRLKAFPRLCVSPRLERYIPKSLTLPDLKPRSVIFASFGAPSQALETYMKERTDDPTNREHWSLCRFDDPAVIEACASKKVELRFDALRHARIP